MNRQQLLFTTILGVAGIGTLLVPLQGQDVPPPPQPSQAPAAQPDAPPADSAQPPATPDQAAPADADQQQGQPEVYNRGPIHEAFAVPGSTDAIKPTVVSKQPPEPIDEVPPDSQPEGENVVWIPGYWAFDEEMNDFLWVTGVWRDIPPGRTWVPGYWTSSEGGYVWVSGNWVDAEVEQVSYLPEPPASEESGPSTEAPGDGYFWVPGNWVYENSDYRWHAGYWAPHQRDWIWIPARYTYSPFGYVYTPGYWDYLVSYRGVAFAPVYFRTHGSFVFTPTVALDSWQYLMLHLFVGPSFRWYYFGDYYGPTYVNLGFVAFFDFHHHHHHRHGFDPLYGYYRWRFGRDFDNRLVGWHRFFRDHDDFRPRRTFREQQDFASRHRDDDVAQATMLSSRFDDIVRSDRLPMKFNKLARDQRDRIVDRTNRLRDFTKDRIDAAKNFKPGGERPSFRVRDNERLGARDNRDDRQPRVRAKTPEFPDRMRDIKPDDREGKSARMPSPRANDRDRFTPDRTLPRFPKSAVPGPREAGKDRPGINRGDAPKKRMLPDTQPRKVAPTPDRPKVNPQPRKADPGPSRPSITPQQPRKAEPAPSRPNVNPPAPKGPPAGAGRGDGGNRPAPKIERGGGGGGGQDRSGSRDGGGRRRS